MAAEGVDSRLFSTTLSRNPGNGASVRASHHTSNAVTSTMPYTTTLDGLRVSVSVPSSGSGFVPTATASLIRRDCSTGSRRSEEHTSELQSLMRLPYAVFCLQKKITNTKHNLITN